MNEKIFIKQSDFDELVKWLKAIYKKCDAFDNSETEPNKYSNKGNNIEIMERYFLYVYWVGYYDEEYWEQDKNDGCIVSNEEGGKDLRLCILFGEHDEHGDNVWVDGYSILKQDAESEISNLLEFSNIHVAQTEEEEKKAIDLDEIVNFYWDW